VLGGRAAAPGSDLNLLGDFQGVIDLDAQVPHRRLKLGVAEQELNGPQVPNLAYCTLCEATTP
jgi:hypothetical protein